MTDSAGLALGNAPLASFGQGGATGMGRAAVYRPRTRDLGLGTKRRTGLHARMVLQRGDGAVFVVDPT